MWGTFFYCTLFMFYNIYLQQALAESKKNWNFAGYLCKIRMNIIHLLNIHRMKKTFLLIALVFATLTIFAQAKKPTIMVVPSDLWCNQNGYTQTFDNQGTPKIVPNYEAALLNDAELLLAISKINEMMTERGFPLKNLESALKTLQNQYI